MNVQRNCWAWSSCNLQANILKETSIKWPTLQILHVSSTQSKLVSRKPFTVFKNSEKLLYQCYSLWSYWVKGCIATSGQQSGIIHISKVTHWRRTLLYNPCKAENPKTSQTSITVMTDGCIQCHRWEFWLTDQEHFHSLGSPWVLV